MLFRILVAPLAVLLLGAAAPSGELTAAEIAALAPVLDAAAAHGLEASGDERLRMQLRDAQPSVRAQASDALRRRAIRYASEQHAGRARPRAVDALWAYEPPFIDIAGGFERARAEGRLAEWLAALAPPHRGYAALVDARGRYVAIVQAGGWAPVNVTGTLRPGEAGPQVVQLRERLSAEGYESQDARDELFGPSLEMAVRAFQAGRGLAVDAVVGPATRKALNVTAAERLTQIDLSLERWRWLPRTLPARRLEVNVAAAEAALIDQGREALRMRIVVGDLAHKTPLFASAIHSVVFNPPWNVPSSIASKEILPKARRDPDYLARNRFSYVAGRLQQAPGPGNALGRVKFDFDSPFGVYLHDTPGRAAFVRDQRTLSHGCMRLEKPRELAALLLGWSAGEVDAAIDAAATRRVRLAQPAPIFVVYQTAWVEADGQVAFRPDVYGWDAKLAAALAGRQAVASAARPAETDCQPNPAIG